jgi:tRNA G18 (ribose-2'-O)-methylase SpoU
MRKLTHDEIPRIAPSEVRDLQRHPIRVLVHDVRSAHNTGAILRTADAALIEHVHLTGFTPTADHKSVHKSALGAQDFVPWSHDPDPVAVIASLREHGYTIGALELTDSPTAISQIEAHHFPLCLVLGNEVDGVDQSLLNACDLAIELAQFGAKQSLNVSVAFGIAAYGLVERWRETTTC